MIKDFLILLFFIFIILYLLFYAGMRDDSKYNAEAATVSYKNF